MNADSKLAESLAILHHKLDAVIRHFNIPIKLVHFVGETCPVCAHLIDYQIDPLANVVIRRCNCSTGKVPSIIPLVQIGEDTNGNTVQPISSVPKQGADPQYPFGSTGGEVSISVVRRGPR